VTRTFQSNSMIVFVFERSQDHHLVVMNNWTHQLDPIDQDKNAKNMGRQYDGIVGE
jgi:hypothetical protein